MRTKLPLYLALLTLTQCSSCKDDDPSPLAQLPPATQQGKNTFGCLVNGQPYTPQGRVGLGPNFDVSYDPTFQGGYLIVRSYRVNGPDLKQYVDLIGLQTNTVGTYSFAPSQSANAVGLFTDTALPVPCYTFDSRDVDVSSRGLLTITRFDQQARVVAGTFAFTLARPGCDTIRVTDGRFDATF